MLPSNVSDFETTSSSPEKKGKRRGGGLGIMLGLLVVLIAVIAVAVSRLPTGSLSRATATSVPTQTAQKTPVAAGTPADGPTQGAVRKDIRQLDKATAEPIATNIPTE